MAADSRKIVLNMLEETTRKGRLSNQVIEDNIAKASGEADSARDRAFIMRLYNGTLERAIYLDYITDNHCQNPRKIKPVIRNILRMSIYQMLFMDSVPVRAAINEAVKLVAAKGLSQLKGFVNGLLRSVQRDMLSCGGGDEDAAAYINKLEAEMPANVRFSVPEWMYDLLRKEYGTERSEAFLGAALSDDKPLFIRTVENRASFDEIIKMLREDSCEVSDPEGDVLQIRLARDIGITALRAFSGGHIFVQDKSSVMAAAEAEEALKRARATAAETDGQLLIVDVCAAPGGKTTYIAEKFPDSLVIARDISQDKTALIEENKARLGLDNIKTQVWDATVEDPELTGRADLVIADLLCSGLGTIGGKPDIRLRVVPDDIESLAALQRQILSVVQGYVKPGGVLAYSTCTVTPQENRENAAWFEENHPFTKIKETQLLPNDGSDGFYSAVFIRRQIEGVQKSRS